MSATIAPWWPYLAYHALARAATALSSAAFLASARSDPRALPATALPMAAESNSSSAGARRPWRPVPRRTSEVERVNLLPEFDVQIFEHAFHVEREV